MHEVPGRDFWESPPKESKTQNLTNLMALGWDSMFSSYKTFDSLFEALEWASCVNESLTGFLFRLFYFLNVDLHIAGVHPTLLALWMRRENTRSDRRGKWACFIGRHTLVQSIGSYLNSAMQLD